MQQFSDDDYPEIEEFTTMYVRCAYCKEWMDAKRGPISVSHGICPKCYEKLKKDLKKKNQDPSAESNPAKN